MVKGTSDEAKRLALMVGLRKGTLLKYSLVFTSLATYNGLVDHIETHICGEEIWGEAPDARPR